MELESFITSSPCALETVMGYDIIPQLQGRILASAPVEQVQILGEVTIAPPEDFFSLALSDEYDHVLFYYSHNYMQAFLSLLDQVPNLVLVAPYLLELPVSLPWMQYYKVGFPTLITFESKSFILHDTSLPRATAQRAIQFASFYTKILILCPDEKFIDALLLEGLQAEKYNSTSNLEQTRILCLVDEQARMVASDFLPDCVIDTCQTRLIFNTTMGGYYKRLVHRSKRDADAFALLASFRGEGLCHRMTTEKAYERYLEEYPWPNYFPHSSLLPLSKKNNQVLSLWQEQGYPLFSLLGPLVLLDNFSPLLFVYPVSFESDSYLFATEQHYKTFFQRFIGEDSLETLCKLWETFLIEVGGIVSPPAGIVSPPAEFAQSKPSLDEVRVWANNNSINVDRLWSCLELVRECIAILEREGVTLETGPSDCKEVCHRARPILNKVYAKRLMFASGIGFEYKSRIYTINTFALPSNLGSNTKEITGLILDQDSVVAGVNF
ncbi:Hypothetical protein BQ3484_560 [Cedratvirus A11]|uniref:Uncharacterized protein n=1 Tax=Cedratvirus A11 TaxID=1903266 RepID=A0A1M7XVS3_9VIRU|nr:Hypothetical protein BQ3484_560 [Cedratvirus A11]SHO33628.1 Hypothetical protein BQ3484_560 [Cedratvirus A11]